MGNFNRDNRDNRSGRRDFSRGGSSGSRFGGGGRGDRRFGDRDSGGGRPSMHKAICDECGKECEVPFRPTGDKPIFCSSCFETKGGQGPRRSGGRRDSGRPSFDDRRMYEAVCDKCGEACEVPFRPTGEKPVYCSQCFEKNGNARGGNTEARQPDQFKEQFEILNSKLDQILKALKPTASGKVIQVDLSKTKEVAEPKKKAEKQDTKKAAKPVQEKAKAKKAPTKAATKKAVASPKKAKVSKKKK